MTSKKSSNKTPKGKSKNTGKGYIDLSDGVTNAVGNSDYEQISKVLSELNLEALDDTQRSELHEFVNTIAIERARDSFYAYVQIMAPRIIPGSKFIYGKHIEMIANDLQSVFESIEAPRDTERSQYFLPPRAMKSVLCSILFPTWVLGKRPDYSIITVGNSTKFAEDRFGRNVRMILQMDEYKVIFPETKLRSDAKSAGRFVTTKGGEYFATGVGSALAGRGAHLILADDVVSEQTAWSKTERNKINEWYLAGARSRLFPTPQGAEIIVNCLTKDTDVWTKRGKVKINEVTLQDEVVSYNLETGMHEFKPVIGVWDNGEDEIWEVTLQDDTKIRGNGKHPILTKDNSYIPLNQLNPDVHKIKGIFHSDLKYGRTRLTSDEAFLLGFMYGDGWTTQTKREKHKSKSYRYVTCFAYGVDEVLNNKVLGLFRTLFGVTMKKTKYGYYRTDTRKVCEWFRTVGGLTGNAHTKRFPNWVFTQPEYIREKFYEGFIEADGHITPKKTRVVGLCNRSLVQDVKDLARSLGYTCSKIMTIKNTTQPPHSPKPVEATQYKICIGGVKRKETHKLFKIKSVVNTKQKENVYDLTVKDNHNFVIDNGVISSNTRWHLEDLSGYITQVDETSKRPWKIFSIPAILDKEAVKLLNGFTSNDSRANEVVFKEGDSFWPQFQPLGGLEEKRESLLKTEPHKWHALYLQNPVAQEGGIVKYEDWQNWNKKDKDGNLRPPQVKSVIVSMDTAFSTSEHADYSAVEVWGVFDLELGPHMSMPCLILLWAEKGKWEFEELRLKALSLYKDERWPKPDMFVIEKKASGQSLIQVLRNQIPIWEYTPDKDKRSRLFACTPYFKQGRIFIPLAKEWAQQVVDEVCNFPSAPNDDLVDACSQAILFFKDNQDIYLDDDGFAFRGEDEDEVSTAKKLTYWSALSAATH